MQIITGYSTRNNQSKSVERTSDAEIQLLRNSERTRRQREALKSALNGDCISTSLKILGDISKDELHGEARYAFFRVDEDNTRLHPIMGSATMPDQYVLAIDGFKVGRDSLACGLAASTLKPQITPNVFEEPLWNLWTHLPREYNFKGCWSFPIRTTEDKAVGTFALYFETERAVIADELELVEVITQTAAIIISNNIIDQKRKRAEEALRESQDKLKQFNSLLETKVAERTSELEQSQRDLQSTNEQLKETISQLESFNYIASHDLQEPLRKVQTFAKLLSEEKLNDPQLDGYLTRIDAAAARMSTLINNLLAYSRLGSSDKRSQPTDLNLILNDVKIDYELLIEEKQAIVEADKLPMVIADPCQMHQLFSNIIGNSLKFVNRRPEINISCAIVKGAQIQNGQQAIQDNDYAKITFKDNGIGFDNGYNKRVFQLFQRLHSQGKYSGTGIGLSIVEKIVKNHNGFVEAISAEGKGTALTVWIPLTDKPL